MQVTNYASTTLEGLLKSIRTDNIQDDARLLVQIFDGRGSFDDFESASRGFSELFPKALIIGTSTAGEIEGGKMLDGNLVVSFAKFEKTELIPVFASECDAKSGEAVGKSLNSEEIKAAILFSDGIGGQPEEFIRALSSNAPYITIGGGAAADNYNFRQTLISLNGAIYTKGVVGVAFKNRDLLVKNDWRLNWRAVGKPMKVTKAVGNVVYEIDSTPTAKIVEKYFGKNVAKNMPLSIIGFPLIKSDDGIDIARAPIAVDGEALVFAGELRNGDLVRFGIADMESLGDGDKEDICYFRPEGIWIYSCAGRKAFAKEALEREFEIYSRLALVSGFFTYGEFFKGLETTNVLNLTTTAFALAEEYAPMECVSKYEGNVVTGESNIAALAHLTNSIVGELEQMVKTLDSYKIVLDSNSIVSKTDKKGVITYVNNLFVQISGYSAEELIGRSHNIIRHPEMSSSVFKEMWMTISSGNVWKGIIKNRAKNGSTYYVDTSIVPLFDENGEISAYIASRTDLTKIIEQQQTIEKQMTDALTGLANRVKFFEDLSSSENPIAALLNIDEFGNINRFYGFETGNQILFAIAEELRRFGGDTGYLVYKFDADNFLIFGQDADHEKFLSDMYSLSLMLHTIVFLPNLLAVKLRFTIGVAASKMQLLSKTEEALKKARMKRINVAVLNEEDEINKRRNFEMLQILEYAINNNRIIPYYQPIVELSSGKTVKFESLMRIMDINGKIYSPFLFLEIAKKSKYYPALTSAMIQKTLADFIDRDESVSINLSMLDIERDECVYRIKEAIAAFKEPHRIIFEITESETTQEHEKVIGFIRDIKALGVKISIDDFGSGYSNFAYLTRFQADFLKIDGSIIKNIAIDSDALKIASVIVDFAKKLGMKTVAEFISSEEIAAKTKELGIDFGQGYLYSEPRPIEDI